MICELGIWLLKILGDRLHKMKTLAYNRPLVLPDNTKIKRPLMVKLNGVKHSIFEEGYNGSTVGAPLCFQF